MAEKQLSAGALVNLIATLSVHAKCALKANDTASVAKIISICEVLGGASVVNAAAAESEAGHAASVFVKLVLVSLCLSCLVDKSPVPGISEITARCTVEAAKMAVDDRFQTGTLFDKKTNRPTSLYDISVRANQTLSEIRWVFAKNLCSVCSKTPASLLKVPSTVLEALEDLMIAHSRLVARGLTCDEMRKVSSAEGKFLSSRAAVWESVCYAALACVERVGNDPTDLVLEYASQSVAVLMEHSDGVATRLSGLSFVSTFLYAYLQLSLLVLTLHQACTMLEWPITSVLRTLKQCNCTVAHVGCWSGPAGC